MRDRLLRVTSAQHESQQNRTENRDNDGPDAAGAGREKCEHLAPIAVAAQECAVWQDTGLKICPQQQPQ